jgi:hypothetical protein
MTMYPAIASRNLVNSIWLIASLVFGEIIQETEVSKNHIKMPATLAISRKYFFSDVFLTVKSIIGTSF